MNKKSSNEREVLGIPFFTGKHEKVLGKIKKRLESDENYPLVIVTPNPEQLVMADKMPEFKADLLKADVRIPDGFGLVVADRLKTFFGNHSWSIRERVTGIDIMSSATVAALRAGRHVFFLGGANGAGRRAKERIEALVANTEYRTLSFGQNANEKAQIDETLLSTFKGSISIEHENEAELNTSLIHIKKHETEILFVAYGAPWQERWVIKNREQLGKIGVKVVMVVGGSFDILAGITPRAPQIMQNLGLEWMWRLWLQPTRWRRQLNLLRFVWLVILDLLGIKKS